jgi:hypothetical protein
MTSVRNCLLYLKEKGLTESSNNLQRWKLFVTKELTDEFPDITDNIIKETFNRL